MSTPARTDVLTREQIEYRIKSMTEDAKRYRADADHVDGEVEKLKDRLANLRDTETISSDEVESVEAVIGSESGAGKDSSK